MVGAHGTGYPPSMSTQGVRPRLVDRRRPIEPLLAAWRRPAVRVALGLAVSTIAVFLVVLHVDLTRTAGVLGAADPTLVVLVGALIGVDTILRAARWRGLLRPIAPLPFPPVLASLAVGLFANSLLPLRLGELVRAHELALRSRVSRASSLGTVVVERVIDTAVVAALAGSAILVLHVGGELVPPVLVGLAASVGLIGALAVALSAHRLPGAQRALVAFARRPAIAGAATRLHLGLAVARQPRTVAEALGWTLAAWSVTSLAFASATAAVGLPVGPAEAGLLAAGVALATAVPAGPGYVGTYELAAVTVGAAVGYPAEAALAVALITRFAGLVVVGGAALIAVGARLARQARSEASPAPEGARLP